MYNEPTEANLFLAEHATVLIQAYRHWTGRELVAPNLSAQEAAYALYHATFVVLSHDATADPCFTYANLSAQQIFEMPWREIVGLPSRFSAEPLAQTARTQLLERVNTHGFIDDYSGVRISRTGKRFQVHHANVWNLLGQDGLKIGQAACFSEWTLL